MALTSEVITMKITKFCGLLSAAVLCVSSANAMNISENVLTVTADEWCYAGETCEPLHDTSRDVQNEGVGNPLNFGERNTPADASTAEIRAINHKMTVQEVKYALYKEIDEHWDLISTRLGQTDREKMYALFLGLGSRESTLGEGKIGSDHETAYEDGWGVNSAHAYGTLQTAVTAFKDCDPKFMPEDNVPEMFQYSFTESNFYDCIISNHMGIRKILHFAEICIDEQDMHDYQVIRNSLKGFNTGWCTKAEDDGAYATYADEICAMAQFYYYEGHLYDNVFTWTSANGDKINKYRTADRWDWWGDGVPSMDPIEDKPTTTTTSTTTSTTTTSTTTTTTTSSSTSLATTTTKKATTNLNTGTVFIADFNEVISYPTKTVYNVGEKLDITGLNIDSSRGTYEIDKSNIEKYTINEFVIADKSGSQVRSNNFNTLPAGVYTVSYDDYIYVNRDGSVNINIRDVKFSYEVTIKGKSIVGELFYGDANCDGNVDMSDAVLIMQALANPNKYGVNGSDENHITTKGLDNADVDASSKGLTTNDALRIQEYLLHKIASLEPIIDG